MKLLLSCLFIACGLQAQANTLTDVLDVISQANNQQSSRGFFNPGRPGRPPGYPPGPGYPGPGRPPGRPPGYPPGGGPGYGNVTCTAADRGWEEHRGHFDCRECLSYHGQCVETCSTSSTECQAQGQDRYGQISSFIGRGNDQWRAQDEALRNCNYNARGCRIVSCNQVQNVFSRRDCR